MKDMKKVKWPWINSCIVTFAITYFDFNYKQFALKFFYKIFSLDNINAYYQITFYFILSFILLFIVYKLFSIISKIYNKI